MLSLLKQKETLPPFEGERGRKLAAWARWMFALLSRESIERHRQVFAVREDLGAAAENRTVAYTNCLRFQLFGESLPLEPRLPPGWSNPGLWRSGERAGQAPSAGWSVPVSQLSGWSGPVSQGKALGPLPRIEPGPLPVTICPAA